MCLGLEWYRDGKFPALELLGGTQVRPVQHMLAYRLPHTTADSSYSESKPETPAAAPVAPSVASEPQDAGPPEAAGAAEAVKPERAGGFRRKSKAPK